MLLFFDFTIAGIEAGGSWGPKCSLLSLLSMTFRLGPLKQKYKYVVQTNRLWCTKIHWEVIKWKDCFGFLQFAGPRLLIIAGYWRTRMANFFIISALNCQNDFKKRKIQARCPSLHWEPLLKVRRDSLNMLRVRVSLSNYKKNHSPLEWLYVLEVFLLFIAKIKSTLEVLIVFVNVQW